MSPSFFLPHNQHAALANFQFRYIPRLRTYSYTLLCSALLYPRTLLLLSLPIYSSSPYSLTFSKLLQPTPATSSLSSYLSSLLDCYKEDIICPTQYGPIHDQKCSHTAFSILTAFSVLFT